MPRNEMPKSHKRTERVPLYLSKSELARWQKAAEKTGYAGRLNDYIRWVMEAFIDESNILK